IYILTLAQSHLFLFIYNFDLVYNTHLCRPLVSICEFCMIFSHLVHALHNNSFRSKMIASVVVTVSQPNLQHFYIMGLKLIRPIDEYFSLEFAMDFVNNFSLIFITKYFEGLLV
uniref:Uncharacterized protein n=1 Tax=Glossina palpalis gambiensis TaxID=67801 RepID=A0A1B0BDZ5_9MUSC